ncbi:hypothetical protein AB6R89_004725 [Salmonella enterica]|nr:hypothetical protein [Salmonella enterica subsp. enterica serovar Give]EIT8869851.1 hypothetical protein [Salmonella enterica subsp. enterica serovar Give]
MGTYIKTCAEIKTPTGWEVLREDIFPQPEGYKEKPDSSPFSYQHYGMFAFLAGVRNNYRCTVLADPRGFPEDISKEALLLLVPEIDNERFPLRGFGMTEEPEDKLTVAEQLERAEADRYGYSWLSVTELAEYNYEQVFVNHRCDPPVNMTYRELLGALYFVHLDTLKKLNARQDVRVLFCFQD